MGIRKTARTTASFTSGDIEVELYGDPIDWREPLVEQVGDTLIVGYLVQDHHPTNPMKDFDGEGVLYTRREGVVTDNESEVYSALCLNGLNEPNIERGYYLNGNRVTLRELAILQFEAANPDIDLDDDDQFSEFEEDIDNIAHGLYSKHWREIVGPYVLPISYHSERGRTMIWVTRWDGDPDDLPDGVWVADKQVQDNLIAYPPGVAVGQIKLDDGMFSPVYELTDNGKRVHEGTLGACWEFMKSNYTTTPADLDRAVKKYAEGVLKQYQAWCEGDVYGCTIETFKLDEDGNWEAGPKNQESVFGYYTIEDAEEQLKSEFFEPAVKHAKKEAATT